jgi:hypothetical protein
VKKLLKRSRFLVAELLAAAIYGVVLYFAFTWLARYSLLYAYFGSLTIMILVIAVEEYSIRKLESDDYLKKLSEQAQQKGNEKYYHSNAEGFLYNLSAKTTLYLFYVFILIFSKIAEYYPTLVSGDISAFIFANNYSILLLIALDMLIGQASKDRERMKRLLVKFKEYFPENKD